MSVLSIIIQNKCRNINRMQFFLTKSQKKCRIFVRIKKIYYLSFTQKNVVIYIKCKNNMFSKEVYISRRNRLREKIGSGLILLPGNRELPFNYSSNTFPFRQDSTFLYFVGIDLPDLFVVVDCNTGDEILFGRELEINDIIWSGEVPSLEALAESAGIASVRSIDTLGAYLKQYSGDIHYVAPYQDGITITISSLLGKSVQEIIEGQSLQLISAIVSMRTVKEQFEIDEIEKAVNITAGMHRQAMRYVGDLLASGKAATERDVVGKISKIAISQGYYHSFPPIVTMHGEVFHSHGYTEAVKKGGLLLVDAGAESLEHYAGDMTRTIPVSGLFSKRQKDIYDIVVAANMGVIQSAMPGLSWRDMHNRAARIITSGLKNLGLMKGDTDNIVASGAYALFFPHGLGHLVGLDVHDMENYGENNVGYSDSVKRSNIFGPSYLRYALDLKKNMVLTDEPGIYFIPQLINLWRKEKKFEGYINYERTAKYIGFGGIRIEDDILITENGCRVLGSPVPKTTEDVESLIQEGMKTSNNR